MMKSQSHEEVGEEPFRQRGKQTLRPVVGTGGASPRTSQSRVKERGGPGRRPGTLGRPGEARGMKTTHGKLIVRTLM